MLFASAAAAQPRAVKPAPAQASVHIVGPGDTRCSAIVTTPLPTFVIASSPPLGGLGQAKAILSLHAVPDGVGSLRDAVVRTRPVAIVNVPGNVVTLGAGHKPLQEGQRYAVSVQVFDPANGTRIADAEPVCFTRVNCCV